MKHLKTILAIITILSMISSGILAWYANYQANEAKRYEANAKALLTKVKTYKDKNGLLVTETYELRFTVSELKNSTDSTIRDMANQVEDMRIKLRNTQNITSIHTETSNKGVVAINKSLPTDSINYEFYGVDSNDTVQGYNGEEELKESHINDGYLDVDIKMTDDNLYYNYIYRDKLTIVGYRVRRMLTKNGKKRFFLARWIFPDWEYKVAAKSQNPRTIIDDIKNVHIETRKGKDRE